MNKKLAIEIAHTLSRTSKMPGASYSIPAAACITGGKLRGKKGTVCESCYACKGAYAWKTTQAALEKRLASLAHPQWPEAMACQIGKTSHFRWHDSGDLQSGDHLSKIARVAELTPATKHWLPTKEPAMVREYLKEHTLHANLLVRVSAPKVNSRALRPLHPQVLTSRTLDAAAVVYAKHGSYVCPAPTQGNRCGDCRACWDSSVADVIYIKH
jgi:hypothetical protein